MNLGLINVVRVFRSKIENGFRKITVLRLGKRDVQSPYESMPFGTDSVPVRGLKAIYLKTGNKGENVIIGYINKDFKAQEGEHRIYSTNSKGEVQTFIWLKNDGKMQLGGDSDNAVRYSELEKAFNELKESHNEMIQTWNTFASQYVPGSPTTVGLPATLGTQILQPTTADITPSKIDEIKTP